MKTILRALLLVLGLGGSLEAATAQATWTANTDPVTGYVLRYGTASGVYTTTIPVGLVTTVPVPNLAPATTYYFALWAVNGALTSPSSAEVIFAVPAAIDPTCVFPLGANAIRITPTALVKTGSGGAGSGTRLDFQVASPGSPITSVGVYANGVAFSPLPGGANPMTGANLGGLAGLWFLFPTVSGTYPVSIIASSGIL